MKQAPDIRFIGMEPSGALDSAAREKIDKIELFCPEIIACHVVIELAHKHRRQGRPFSVRLSLTLPGHELAVSRVENEDVYVALRDAFDDMRRQVEDTMRRMRPDKNGPPLGEVAAATQREPAMKDQRTAGEICSRIVTIGYPSMALNEAARLMRERHVGCLVVVEEVSPRESVVVGVLTDRDLALGVVAADRDPHGMRVGDIMTRDVVKVREEDSLADVLAAMQRKGVRRVPVTGPKDVLLGIVALDDVLEVLAQQMQAVAGSDQRRGPARADGLAVKRADAPALLTHSLLPAAEGALPADALCTRCDTAQFEFETTEALPQPEQPFGQARAVDAVALGLDITGRGYNLFVLGRPGSGRHEAVRGLLQAHAQRREAPVDWCYIYNFTDPNKPRVLSLPAGEGTRLRAGMQGFVGELGRSIEVAFDSEEYRSRIEAIEKEYKDREGQALQALGKMAADQDVALLRTPQGFAFAPMKDGAPMTAEQLEALSETERERIGHLIESMREPLLQLMHDLPRMRREMQTRMREASRDTMGYAAGHLIEELKEQFATHPAVLSFLDEVLKDVLEAGQQLREQHNDEDESTGFTGSLSLVRYQVNLLVGHQPTDRAPVLACENPTYANLVGRVDHQPHMGTLLTNFTLIKAGSLHLANGGYLMLDALQVLGQAYAWDGLKRALKTGKVAIESLPQVLGWVSTLALEPEPVPLALKIVLFGERRHYYLLQALDPEFDDLFKVAADFEDEVPRDAIHTALYARLAGAMARTARLRALDRGAVAKLVEYAARTAGDAGKLSTDTRKLDQLLHEADLMAGRAGREAIAGDDVTQALAARTRRADRLRDTLHDAVRQETLSIATSGSQLGQVNGLAVIELGEFRFGHPVRISATARLGEGELVDIERESSLGQPIHSKGVLILAAFLRSRYAQDIPFSLSASLVFEQSYGPVEGDSASLAELCALLSALAGLPLRQSLAVTGSIDQAGAVQAIGGVNEKIEGFFDVCRTCGLDGQNGVLIPKANVRHLMLREDVVEAARGGLFHVYPVADVDQAVALLTGQPAGQHDASGRLPPGSVNQLVAARLAQLSLDRQAYATGQPRRVAARWRKPPRASRSENR